MSNNSGISISKNLQKNNNKKNNAQVNKKNNINNRTNNNRLVAKEQNNNTKQVVKKINSVNQAKSQKNKAKKLSEKKREELYEQIKKEAVAYAICEVDNIEIEKYNIYNAARIAMQRAVEKLKVKPDFLLIDAMPFENYPIPNFSMVKGDEKSVSIAAASVIAKVYRDNLMKEYAKKYPHYDFENNAGYGTKKHLEGLKEHGVTSIHRRDFEPIKSMIQGGKHE